MVKRVLFFPFVSNILLLHSLILTLQFQALGKLVSLNIPHPSFLQLPLQPPEVTHMGAPTSWLFWDSVSSYAPSVLVTQFACGHLEMGVD